MIVDGRKNTPEQYGGTVRIDIRVKCVFIIDSQCRHLAQRRQEKVSPARSMPLIEASVCTAVFVSPDMEMPDRR